MRLKAYLPFPDSKRNSEDRAVQLTAVKNLNPSISNPSPVTFLNMAQISVCVVDFMLYSLPARSQW